MSPDIALERTIQGAVESEGDRLTDLHLWRLGAGHLGAIIAIETTAPRDCEFYQKKFGELGRLSHITVEVHEAA